MKIWTKHGTAGVLSLRLPIGGAKFSDGHGGGMGFSPVAHGFEERPQGFSQWSYSVDNARRRIRVHRALQDPRSAQIAQLLRQRSLGDTGYTALKLGKSLLSLEKLIEDGRPPSPTHDTRSGFHRAEYRLFRHIRLGSTLYTKLYERTPLWQIPSNGCCAPHIYREHADRVQG
jgi:hypothetical protein